MRYRRLRAAEMLEPVLEGQSLLDLGCGSGLLFRDLAHTGASSFHGLEWAASALEHGRELARNHGYAARAHWLHGDLEVDPWPDCDIVVALGVLDWLSPEGLLTLPARLRGKRFLLSFSEDRPSLARRAHQAYTWLAYGYRTGGYRPRYHRACDLRQMLSPISATEVRVLREPGLGFGAFIHNLGPEVEEPTRQQKVDRYFLRRWESSSPPNFVLARFRRAETAAVLRALHPLADTSVLDLGCGDGWYLRQVLPLRPRRYLGVDRHPHSCGIPGSDPQRVVICRSDIERFVTDQRFDRVLCAGLLEFLEQPDSVLRRLPDLLSDEGRLVLLFPRLSTFGRCYRFLHRLNGYSVHLLDPARVGALLERQGLRVTNLENVLGLSVVLTARRS